jgi:hypothetical protein
MIDAASCQESLDSGCVGLWGSPKFDLPTEYDCENDNYEALYEASFSSVCHMRFLHEDFALKFDGPECKSQYSTVWFYQNDVFYSEADDE